MITREDCYQLDQMLRSGQVARVRDDLMKLNLKSVPRAQCALAAELFRRAGLPHHAVRLLNRLARSEGLGVEATAVELAEYAMALIKIGAIDEGREILSSPQMSGEPRAKLYLGYSYFPEWEFKKGIEVLDAYLASAQEDVYQALVAEANLTAALLSTGELKRAEEIIERRLKTTSDASYHLLHANFLELSAQLALKTEHYRLAVESLEKAASVLAKSGTSDELFVVKWRALVDCYEKRGAIDPLGHLQEVRDRALERCHWETVRDLDYHLAYLNCDTGLYHHLFHGTPFLSYRQVLKENFSMCPEPPPRYEWRLGEGGSAVRLDIEKLTVDAKPRAQKLTPLLHSLLLALATDFYKPVRLATLAQRLFPGEYYHPQAMPNRLYQLIRRLRIWAEDLGLGVEEFEGSYRLTATRPVIVVTALNQDRIAGPGAKLARLIAELRALSLPEIFSSKEVALGLSCSPSGAARLLKLALDSGVVEKIGTTSYARYRFLHHK